MADNDWKKRLGVVYSTNPDYKFQTSETKQHKTPNPAEQDLRVWLDSKNRSGKTVTIIRGFIGKNEDLEALAKKLKATCGTGGTAKDGEIIIQGNHRDKIVNLLQQQGYKVKKAGA